MRRLLPFTLVPLLALALPTTAAAGRPEPEPFDAADLRIEVNATDGDAGLQLFLDHEAWKHIRVKDPKGRVLVDIRTQSQLEDYGLTELFSESSEPPFSEFPFSRFKQLFPAGSYTFFGETVDGRLLQSRVPLTHDVPDGPEITSPAEDETLAEDDVIVRWEPTTTPKGIRIVGYEVIVSREDDERILDVDLGVSARRFRVSQTFLEADTEYKVEVLAIEISGNQTLTEVAFATA